MNHRAGGSKNSKREGHSITDLRMQTATLVKLHTVGCYSSFKFSFVLHMVYSLLLFHF